MFACHHKSHSRDPPDLNETGFVSLLMQKARPNLHDLSRTDSFFSGESINDDQVYPIPLRGKCVPLNEGYLHSV